MAILLVDCFDSFTFNLVHYIEGCTDASVRVIRPCPIHSEILDGVTAVVFSPGPGLPSEVPHLFGWMSAAMEANLPILGVCLGLQTMAEVSGGMLKQLPAPHHGVSHEARHNGKSKLFHNVPAAFEAGRYHSWMVKESSLGDEWIVTARDSDGEVMAMEHRINPWYGIQFHPESVLTPSGREIVGNFMRLVP